MAFRKDTPQHSAFQLQAMIAWPVSAVPWNKRITLNLIDSCFPVFFFIVDLAVFFNLGHFEKSFYITLLWRQHTGSGLSDQPLVCPTAKIHWATLMLSPSIEKTRPPYRQPSRKIACGLRPPSSINAKLAGGVVGQPHGEREQAKWYDFSARYSFPARAWQGKNVFCRRNRRNVHKCTATHLTTTLDFRGGSRKISDRGEGEKTGVVSEIWVTLEVDYVWLQL